MVITKSKVQYLTGTSVKLKVISDVHLGNKWCDTAAFKRYLDERDKQTYFIGLGDYADAILPGDPRYTKSSDGGDKESMIDEQVDRFVEYLNPLKDKVLGLASGNHERQVLKRHGTDMVKRMSGALGVPYLGYSGLFNLTLIQGKKNSRSVIIRYHHGWGGGSRTQGADLTKFSRECANWDADLFLYGHVHRLQADKVPRLGLAGNTLVARPQQLCICGTFLKTFGDDPEPTYSEEKGYPPIETGGLEIGLTPKRIGFKMNVSL